MLRATGETNSWASSFLLGHLLICVALFGDHLLIQKSFSYVKEWNFRLFFFENGNLFFEN